jgi:hypothetical protein
MYSVLLGELQGREHYVLICGAELDRATGKQKGQHALNIPAHAAHNAPVIMNLTNN